MTTTASGDVHDLTEQVAAVVVSSGIQTGTVKKTSFVIRAMLWARWQSTERAWERSIIGKPQPRKEGGRTAIRIDKNDGVRIGGANVERVFFYICDVAASRTPPSKT